MLETADVFSANEAASVTGVPLKQVHRIVDAGLLEGAVERRDGARVILGRGLLGLRFAHATANLLTPEARRRLVHRLLSQPKARTVFEDSVSVDVRPMVAAIRDGRNTLAKAKKIVTVDEDVLGGAPCFKGTRIPVHDIAAMAANGDDKTEILAAYPRITAEQVELARVYAEAYPRRGRPRVKPPWRKAEPVSREEVRLADLRRD